MHKFASNVIEKCLNVSANDERKEFIDLIIDQFDNNG